LRVATIVRAAWIRCPRPSTSPPQVRVSAAPQGAIETIRTNSHVRCHQDRRQAVPRRAG
jgi:hypothetical protein